MRVLVISDVCGKLGGAYLATLNLCRALTRQGHEVRCCATHFDARTDFDIETFTRIVPLIRFGHRWKLPSRALVQQAKWIFGSWKPKLVICVGLTSLTTQVLQTFPKKSTFAWELTNATTGNKFVDSRIHTLLSRSIALLSPSQTIDQNIRKTYGYSGPIKRLPFWTEPTLQLQTKLSNNKSPLKNHDFLFLGRRDPEKGIKELIQATASLLSEFPGIRVAVAGAGDAEPFAALANSLNISSANLYFLSLPNHLDALAELAKARYLALPSYHEGYPLSLLEAAEYGIPFIASDVGSIAEVFGGSFGCHIVPAKDVVSLANAMRSALEMPQPEYRKASEQLQCQYRLLCSDEAVVSFLSQLSA